MFWQVPCAHGLRISATAAISVPSEAGSGLDMDWSKINWSAGVDINLFLDRIPLRNAYRSQLITFDQTLRAREQAEDRGHKQEANR